MLYEDVHGFLKERVWAPAQIDTEVACITWVEMFTLFDVTGRRSEEGQHVKTPAATRRADKKKSERTVCKNQQVEPQRNDGRHETHLG